MNDAPWSQAELSIVRALSIQLRMMTLKRVARGWFENSPNPIEDAGIAISRFRRAGLIDEQVYESHPLLPQQRPLFAWNLGQQAPGQERLAALEKQSRTRWKRGHISVNVFRASKRACRTFGAFVDARHARSCEITHDLHLAEVFVRYRLRKPEHAAQWLGEGAFPKLGFDLRGMKDPDAFLIGPTGAAYRVIEFAGSYEADHLQAFHLHCAGGGAQRLAKHQGLSKSDVLGRLYPSEGVGYELW